MNIASEPRFLGLPGLPPRAVARGPWEGQGPPSRTESPEGPLLPLKAPAWVPKMTLNGPPGVPRGYPGVPPGHPGDIPGVPRGTPRDPEEPRGYPGIPQSQNPYGTGFVLLKPIVVRPVRVMPP